MALIKEAKAMGYTVSLLFFWLPSPQMAEQRVRLRVQEGGHHIPTDVIHRRYTAGLRNFFELYQNAVDEWWFSENTQHLRVIAYSNHPYIIVDDVALWDQIRIRYAK